MKKFLGIIILTVIFVTDAYALLGGKKQQSSPDYIYVSNKEFKKILQLD